MATGFLYLVAVMDWWSRYVLGWRLSNTMEAAFCVDAWEAALRAGRQASVDFQHRSRRAVHLAAVYRTRWNQPEWSEAWMARGRWLDNPFIERLWRSVKYEDIYVQDYGGGLDAGRGLGRWFDQRQSGTAAPGVGLCDASGGSSRIPAPMERSQPAGRRCNRRRAGNHAPLDSRADGRRKT